MIAFDLVDVATLRAVNRIVDGGEIVAVKTRAIRIARPVIAFEVIAGWIGRLQYHAATVGALVIPRHLRVVLDLVSDIPDRRSTCRTRAFAAKLVAVQWTFSDIDRKSTRLNSSH